MTDDERKALTGDPRDLTSREVTEALRDIRNARGLTSGETGSAPRCACPPNEEAPMNH